MNQGSIKLDLIVETKIHQGLTFSPDGVGIYRVGRTDKADLALTGDRYVSRNHCEIEVTPTGVWILDVGSRSGTFVNGQRVKQTQLAHGDTILIGRTALHVSLKGGEPPAQSIEPSTGVPGFTLLKKLPNEGPGEVWWAFSSRDEQLITLHFMPLPAPTETKTRDRFMRQATLCARLHHPGLVQFLAQGISGDILWFATEVIQAPTTLPEFIAQNGLFTLDEAVDLLTQAIDIVIYLHQENIVHRSLRPESFLLVKKHKERFTLRLADLGSAKCFQMPDFQSITETGERGYPVHAYTAPEALFNFQRRDPRSDIYALGAIFYFVLAGQAPYQAPDPGQLMTVILETDLKPLLTLRLTLPTATAEVIERAMNRDLDRRYSSAQEMHKALHQASKQPIFTQTKPATASTVFISYSHKDEVEKEQILSHLGILHHADLIDLWSDDRIGAGANWEAEITQAISKARVAVLLITANFLTSDFILGHELPSLLNRYEREGLVVFPVIAKACAWRTVDWLTPLNVRPKNGHPIWSGTASQIDEALATIAEEVALIVN